MSANRRLAPDYHVVKHRVQDERIAMMESSIQSINRATSVAHWEKKSDASIQRRRIMQVAAKKEEEYLSNLNRRREKLALLLQNEREELEEQFRANFETPEQTRERMKARANELKARREEERRELAERCLLQRARLAQDEMRLEESKLRTQKVVKDQIRQMEEKEEEIRRQKDEEEAFAREWLASAEHKKEREIREANELAMRNNHMREVLDAQVEDKQSRTQREIDQLESDRRKWRNQWRREEEMEKEAMLRKLEEQRIARLETQHANFRFIEAKEQEKLREAELDRYLLNEQMEKDRLAEAGKRAERIAQAKASREFNKHLREMAIKEKADESHLEKIRLEEQEKEWQKREARWKRENDAREALLEEVDRTRKAQIEHRRRITEDERAKDVAYIRQKKLEDAELDAKINEQMRQEAERRHLNYKLLQEQISEKERLQAIERQRDILIDKRAQRYTEEFQKKVAQMREEVLASGEVLENFKRKTYTSH